MRILHIGTADNEGGAARAAYRLHLSFRQLGHHSQMLVRTQVTADHDVQPIRGRTWSLLDRVMAGLAHSVGLQDVYYPSSQGLLNHEWVVKADVIQLHNLHGFYFPFPAIRRLSREKPLVWLLHDMWPLTGHCTYSYGCHRWKEGCGECPLLRDDYMPLRYDTTAFHWRLKQETYLRSRVRVVAPSRWLCDLAKESPLMGHFPIHHIPYGLDTERFFPIDRGAARQVLCIDSDMKVILFSAHVVGDNPRKGASFLRNALAGFSRQRLDEILVLIAGGNGPDHGTYEGIRYRNIGYISNDYLLTAVYSSADVFVLPSLADNLPLSIMESLACGTPVIAFDIGGIPDMVRHMETGYLCKYKNTEDLANGIITILGDVDLRQRLGRRCRDVAVQEYSSTLQAKRHLELYGDMTRAQFTPEGVRR